MNVQKIAVVVLVVSLVGTGYLILMANTGLDLFHRLPDSIQPNLAQRSSYANLLTFDQQELQLKHEVVQYEIKFHHQDVVNVSVSMYVRYIDRTITSEYFLLTDGEKPLFRPLLLFYVPERKYSLITPRFHLSFGQFFLWKFLDHRGKIFMGSGGTFSKDFSVHDGESWYLTMGVPTTAEQSIYSVVFTSENTSMDVSQLTRHDKLGFYSADYHQFSGKYYALKLLFLGGFSICDVNREATTTSGLIISMFAVGHRKGSMTITLPNRTALQSDQKRAIVVNYIGNQSGVWQMRVKGWSLYFRMAVLFLYIDIDPKCNELYFN